MLLGAARHIPERLCGGIVYLEALQQMFSFFAFFKILNLNMIMHFQLGIFS